MDITPPNGPAPPNSSPRGPRIPGTQRRTGDSNDSSENEEETNIDTREAPFGGGALRRPVDANFQNQPGRRGLGLFDADGRRGGHNGDGLGGHTFGIPRKDDQEEAYIKESLPQPADNEIEFLVPNALTHRAGEAVRSPTKTVGNFQWRLYVFPAGTVTTRGDQVSAFVEAVPPEGLDQRWMFQQVKYQIVLVNWLNYRISVVKTDSWSFSKDGIDRGWHDILRISELTRESGWLGPDNSLCFRASVYVRQADTMNVNNEYNVRKETGFIGLKNHGATCYMNGLLQSLFHVGEFRRIVYSIDCGDSSENATKEDIDSDSLKVPGDVDGEGKAPPLIESLQNVFYKLQTSEVVVNCRELMKSFGWDTMDAFTQHDAQELNRILCDRLEEQMKGTPMDGSIKRLFEGEMENFIECMDVDYKSKRNETFYDIQLNIKGEKGQDLQNIEESLKDYTEVEILEGDNAYEAEGYGKQRAKKGIRFLKFPPVLNLQLKRFHFDLEKMDMVKLNSKFEFHRKLDLSSVAPEAGVYLLHAVVVHSGDVNSGHYYVYIRPNLDGGWFKFDDDTVTPCSEYAAVEDNYGGNDLVNWNYFDRTPRELQTAIPPTRPRIHNAYMLVYVREDCAPDVLKSPDPRQTNPKMVERCDREVRLAEQRRKEKMEQQMKIRIKLVYEKDLCKMTGFWDHQEIRHSEGMLKLNRDQLVKDLAAEVETTTQVPAAHLAFFVLTYRTNPRQVRFSFVQHTNAFRQHIPAYSAPHFDMTDPYLVVLCVMSRGYDMHSFKWKPKSAEKLEAAKPDQLVQWNDDQVILMIVKYFCVKTHNIVTLGCYYTHQSSEPLINTVTTGWLPERLKQFIEREEVAPVPEYILNDAAQWECWEEFGERDLHFRNVKRSARIEHLWSGDVVIWQVHSEAGDMEGNPTSPQATQEGTISENEEVAPMYPVHNVQDYAAHLSNAIDVTVTLHDPRQPLSVDDVVANGIWGAQRPQSASKEGKVEKEEKPEEAALLQSLVEFNKPKIEDLKMDLRWQFQHVTGMIAKTFGLPANTQLWLFHGPPSSTADEPLNTPQARPNTEGTLKELQRSVMYITAPANKRPFHLHAVEVPDVGDRQSGVIFVRFYDDAVREVGNCIVAVPSAATTEDVLQEAKKHIKPEWNITGTLRAFEVVECRVNKLFTQSRPQTHVPIRSLTLYTKCNIFYNCLRVEADPDANLAADQKLVEIFHCDRQTQQAFAQPFLMPVAVGEKSGSLKARCKTKLNVPDAEFKSWRLVRCGRNGRTHLKDEDPWDAEGTPDMKLCLEHVHPNQANSLARQSRYNKPLTIKG